MKRSVAGYTLIELMIGTAVGSILTLAAVSFASHQTKLIGFTNDAIEMSQASRTGLDRLKSDLRLAGAGIGYNAAGEFAGLRMGFLIRGGATFNSNNYLLLPPPNPDGTTGLGEPTFTDDITITMANGDYATIASFGLGGTGQLCHGSNIKEGDVVLFRSEDGLSAQTVNITSMSRSACALGQCEGGCDAFTWQSDPSYQSGPDASTAQYSGGEALGGFETITYFIEKTDPNGGTVGRLRRTTTECSARDHTCGEVILDNVESLQTRIYQRTRTGWIDRTNERNALSGRERIRVDLELIVRARRSDADREHPPAVSNLETSLCLPSCGTQDNFQRKIVRTSIELKNGGRVSFYRSEQ